MNHFRNTGGVCSISGIDTENHFVIPVLDGHPVKILQYKEGMQPFRRSRSGFILYYADIGSPLREAHLCYEELLRYAPHNIEETH